LVALIVLLMMSGTARATTVELYTMGRGADLFSAFGHAAICVHDERSPEGRCYNYGTADFRTPLPLTWDFIRGRARFWVSVLDQPRMLYYYAREGRAVWRQRLPLDEPDAARLAAALEASTDEKVKYYRYHHFNDNCTTRIRDLMDVATGGALRRDVIDRGRSFRAWARDGFAGSWPLLVAVELLLGRPADRHTDSWTAMFLPSELRAEVATRLHASPELVVPGRFGPESGPPSGSRWLGQLAFVLGGLFLAIVLWVGARLGRVPRRLALLVAGVTLGLVAVVLDALALLSSFPELQRNEALLLFWPTDLALPLLPRWLLSRYATARLVVLAAIVLAHAFALTQPLAPVLLVGLPLGAIALDERRFANNLVV
jgi:hypothetical protein